MPHKDSEERRAYDREWRRKRLARGLCPWCGKLRDDQAKCACDACLEKYRRPRVKVDGRRRTEWNECATCGKKIPKYRKYCSQECRYEAGRVYKVCSSCGKEFMVSRSMADRYNVCSLECSPHGNPRVTKICEQCGKEFDVRYSDARKRSCRFCSFICYRQYSGNNAESGLERKVRLILEGHRIYFIRQHAVSPKTVYDFFFPGSNLVLDVDGDYWHSSQDAKRRDARKDKRARRHGYHVERIAESIINEDSSSVWLRRLIDRYHLKTDSTFPMQLSLGL